MQKKLDRWHLAAACRNRSAQTLRQYEFASRLLLAQLSTLHPIFSRLAVLGREAFGAIDDDLGNLEFAIRGAIAEAPEDLSTLNQSTAFSGEVTGSTGFRVVYSSRDSDNRHVPLSAGGIRLTLRGVGTGPEQVSGVILSLPENHYGELHKPILLRQIIGVLVSAWDIDVAEVRSAKFEQAVQSPGDLYSGKWMLYFHTQQFDECLLNRVNAESIFGGVLITAKNSVPDAENPSDVDEARSLRVALDEFGLVWHSTYAIHGWPPDEEEWRYEEFISGAPRGRKYRVRCIDFDGYDAQRDVLLYAKLFRQLRTQRKEWGLRGWDGPVLNEAKRQVRAANGTQIEWHVGLEEPVARVRTLLADYTDITEQQLRVIYTPVNQMVGV